MADKSNLDFLKQLNDLQNELNKKMTSTMDFDERIRIQEDAIANSKRIQAEQERLLSDSKSKNSNLTTAEKKELDQILKTQKNINEEVKKEGFWREVSKKTLRDYNSLLKQGWRYLMDSDKVIKNTILNLGLSGTKAAEMRGSFEDSARFVAHIGGNLEDVQKIMEGFAEETGRARALSAEMVQDIALIGKGTGLGIEQGAKLGAQFELMGINAKSAMDYVQNVVDTSERMGVNTTKVLKNVTENFKKLQTMSFQQGVKGYAQMAQYAEKMKIDMNSTFAAMDKVKTLEGAIDTFAQLQVMGGEFAKQDFLEMFYLKRNDPKRFQERINDMTKGVVSFRRMADGSMEKFISPADRDRLDAVERTLGMQTGELTTQALRMAEMQRMRQKMQGMGLSGAEKELIEGAAVFNTETGAFEAKVAGQMRDITTLTKAQAQSFAKETVSLKQRAEEAMTVEDAFKATILELKSALLPLLQSINVMLTSVRDFVKPAIDWLTSGHGAWIKVASAFMAASFAWRFVSTGLQRAADSLVKGIGSRIGKKAVEDVLSPGPAGSPSGLFEQRKGIGAGALAKGQGMKAMGIGAGVGAGAVGIGAGIGVAAVGISKLADSMSKLTPDQAKTLNSIIKSLGWFVLGGALAAGAIIAIGLASTAAAPGLLTLGGAVLMVGGGIALATAGIGAMAFGLGEMLKNAKGAGKDMLQIGAGIGLIGGALALAGVGGWAGLGVLGGTLGIIALSSAKVGRVGDAFEKIGVAMRGSKEDFLAVAEAVKTISAVNTKGGGMLADLANLLKTPLKVEFANKEVAVVSNITMNIDGQKFHQATKTGAYVTQNTVDAKSGKSGPV